jgi:hypothetical protein
VNIIVLSASISEAVMNLLIYPATLRLSLLHDLRIADPTLCESDIRGGNIMVLGSELWVFVTLGHVDALRNRNYGIKTVYFWNPFNARKYVHPLFDFISAVGLTDLACLVKDIRYLYGIQECSARLVEDSILMGP